MFCFRTKCKLRQCPRLNSKFLKSWMTSDPSFNPEAEHQDVVNAESQGQHVSQIVDELIDSFWQKLSVPVNPTVHVTDSLEVGISKTRPKVFPCPTCGRLFSQYPSALKHCIRKQEALIATCPICGKVITEKKNLKRHIASHKNKRFYVKSKEVKCDGCAKVFTSRQRLESHMVCKHGVQKLIPEITDVFECEQCSFTHVKKSVLKTHIGKVHSEGIKVNCDQCDYFCLSKSGMIKHKRIVHKSVRKEVTVEGFVDGPISSPTGAQALPNLSLPGGQEGHVLSFAGPGHVLSLAGRQVGHVLSLAGKQAGQVRPQQEGPQPLYGPLNQMQPSLSTWPALPVARKTQPHPAVTPVQSKTSDISLSVSDTTSASDLSSYSDTLQASSINDSHQDSNGNISLSVSDVEPFLSQNFSASSFDFSCDKIVITDDGKEILIL